MGGGTAGGCSWDGAYEHGWPQGVSVVVPHVMPRKKLNMQRKRYNSQKPAQTVTVVPVAATPVLGTTTVLGSDDLGGRLGVGSGLGVGDGLGLGGAHQRIARRRLGL